jgi:hypothetical protein
MDDINNFCLLQQMEDQAVFCGNTIMKVKRTNTSGFLTKSDIETITGRLFS